MTSNNIIIYKKITIIIAHNMYSYIFMYKYIYIYIYRHIYILYILYIYIYWVKKKLVHDTQSAQHAQRKEHNTYLVTS